MNDRVRWLMADVLVRSVHPAVTEWSGDDRVRRFVEEELDRRIEKVEDREFGSWFQSCVGVPEAETKDFWHRFLELPGGVTCLVGIRFKGTRVEMPFVELLGMTEPVDSSERLRELMDVIRPSFAVFSPLWLRIWRGSRESLEPLDPFEVTGDLRTLTAPLSVLREQAKPSDRLRLEPATDLGFLPRYEALYEKLRDLRPELADEVQASSAQELWECMSQGLLFQAYDKDRWAGVVAARAGTGLAFRGHCVDEEVLVPELRGCGLGPVLQRGLIDRIKAPPESHLFGTIHPGNTASLATARRCGRIDIGGYFFIGL